MKISKVWAVSFSPTGTSRKIIGAIASGITDVEIPSIDLTLPDKVEKKTFKQDELVIIGVPVYAGRVAPLAASRLKAIKGDSTPVVLVVLFGNRDYEDALIELKDLAEAASFTPVAASAFIGEHSFSSPEIPIASGRPDNEDLATACTFGKSILEKLNGLQDFKSIPFLKVPGNTPYKEGMGSLPVTPQVNTEACTCCGLCVSTCPGGAISIDSDDLVIEIENCIFCCACIKTCPENALAIAAPLLQEKRQALHENCAERKEPEQYL